MPNISVIGVVMVAIVDDEGVVLGGGGGRRNRGTEEVAKNLYVRVGGA